MTKKTKVVIDGVTYEIPKIVFEQFKEIALDRDRLEIAVENLEEYIYNYTGTNAKA